MKRRILSLVIIALSLLACNNDDSGSSQEEANSLPAPVNISFQIVNVFPHDTSAFTEGLVFHKGQLYEGTGSPDSPVTNSGTWIASIELKTGKYDKKVNLGKTYFGEGITFLNDKLFQLTWKNHKGFIYDANTFKKLKEFTNKEDGWGLTNDGRNLIMSTGTSNLFYINPDSLNFSKILPVQNNNGFQSNINELEYINGYIYANEWLTPNILKIDPATGNVVAKMDLSKQVAEIKSKYPDAEEMNGIAYDSTTRKIYITGKKWPVIYEIKW